ncbi:fasciclin-like arabinogalactan protein 3-like [Trifolium pratense]|uniref:Fasciclin-like arabinogalactan protein 3-like n=1 Tax=Trifolium pratense TaxID=57577 RepID=A0A2K3N3U4_TRIPR|nr:fasciclin-like arabinogalactan protein 3-like [Trifolium pratense]
MCGKMGFKSSSFLCLTIFFAISSSIHAFNITRLLGQNPDFSTFNNYLTETKLVKQINSRNTITVLVLSNGAISSISGKDPEVIKAILSTHVILDYFDEKKLRKAQGTGELLTTLYQSTGLAVNNQGFLKVKLNGEGVIVFGSAVVGAPKDDELVQTVLSIPYNISILQVAKPIVPPGIDTQLAPPKGAMPPEASAKAPVPTTEAPAADASSPSEEVTSPPSPSEVITDSPAEAPTADAPSPSLAPGPGDDEGGAADAETNHSSSSRTVVGLVGAIMCFTSLLFVM